MVTKADTPKASYWHDQDLAPPQKSAPACYECLLMATSSSQQNTGAAG